MLFFPVRKIWSQRAKKRPFLTKYLQKCVSTRFPCYSKVKKPTPKHSIFRENQFFNCCRFVKSFLNILTTVKIVLLHKKKNTKTVRTLLNLQPSGPRVVNSPQLIETPHFLTSRVIAEKWS